MRQSSSTTTTGLVGEALGDRVGRRVGAHRSVWRSIVLLRLWRHVDIVEGGRVKGGGLGTPSLPAAAHLHIAVPRAVAYLLSKQAIGDRHCVSMSWVIRCRPARQ